MDNIDNALYLPVVVPLRKHMQAFLGGYKSRSNSNLTMQAVDGKFLQADPLENIKRFFVAVFHEIYHLAPLNSTKMINNDYSKLKIVDTLFNLGLIVDQILEYRFLGGVVEKKMASGVFQLALNEGWTNPISCPDPGAFLRKIKPALNGLPDIVVPYLLDGTATYDGSLILDAKMRAVLLAYHLRNYGGHHLEGSTILVSRYNEVLNLVMDALFVAIESL